MTCTAVEMRIPWFLPLLAVLVVASDDNDTLWGAYRPNLYFGMRPQIPQSLMTGLIWFGAHDYQSVSRASSLGYFLCVLIDMQIPQGPVMHALRMTNCVRIRGTFTTLAKAAYKPLKTPSTTSDLQQSSSRLREAEMAAAGPLVSKGSPLILVNAQCLLSYSMF